MKQAIAVAVACFAVTVLALDPNLDAVHKAFYDSDIFGGIIPATNFSYILGLQYTVDGESSIDTFSGINLTKPIVENQPILQLKVPITDQGVDPERKLVLLAIDPDAPSPKNRKWSNVLHWLQGDLHTADGGSDEKDNLLLLNRTEPVLSYMPPSPPEKSSAHRYVFLLYDSTPEFENLKSKPKGRKHFSLKKFIKKAKLSAPIAGTFFWVSANPDDIPTMTIESFGPAPTAAKEEPLVVQRGGINLLEMQ